MSSVAADKDAYRQSFDRFVGAARPEPEWLLDRRTSAFGRYVENGLPGPRDEAWRQTPIGPITKTRWVPADLVEDASVKVPLGSMEPRIVLVDGHVSLESSTLPRSGAGVQVHRLSELLAAEPDRLEPLLGRVLSEQASVFASLNTAFASDGVVVFLDGVADTPLHVAHVATGLGQDTVAYSRVLVVAAEGSQGQIVETFTGPDGARYLSNGVTEVIVEANASVDHYRLQTEGRDSYHVATLSARLDRDARFQNHSFNFGAAISRTDIEVRFEDEGGECVLNGLFVLDGARLTDTHSRVDHAQPHCTSHELYKGVLDDTARGVFNGLVQVRPGAQKTDAEQMNRNLLLSRQALVHSVPQLEILADDVKCRHGSTTGQLDPQALFYLRSRGIGEAEARALLTYAFASDLVRGVPVVPLKNAILDRLQGQLGADFAREVAS